MGSSSFVIMWEQITVKEDITVITPDPKVYEGSWIIQCSHPFFWSQEETGKRKIG